VGSWLGPDDPASKGTVARIGLVLGGGGITGGAFHAGVLAGLADSLGWDARTAELVVGTSAGSLTAAVLRAGLAPGDLLARSEGRALSEAGSALFAAAGVPPGPTVTPAAPDRFPRGVPAAPRALLRAGRAPWRARPATVMAALLPEGTASTSVISGGLAGFFPHGWPERALWICAVRIDDLRLVVFGRDGSPEVAVEDAVAASCAIPGYFRPVHLHGVRYVDGGAHSVTNLDQCRGLGLDVVVVSSPLAGPAGIRTGPGFTMRGAARAQLGAEARRVRRSGTAVVTLTPTVADQAAMGINAMDAARRAAVARQTYESTLARLERRDFRGRLVALTDGSP
jgi:NTE family protein